MARNIKCLKTLPFSSITLIRSGKSNFYESENIVIVLSFCGLYSLCPTHIEHVSSEVTHLTFFQEMPKFRTVCVLSTMTNDPCFSLFPPCEN